MLITLKSDNDSNANLFTNYFKEGIIIEPNSEIALINGSYKLGNQFVIGGTNNQFQMALAPLNAQTTITLAQGTYTNLATLATEIQTKIRAYGDGLDDFTKSLFPSANMTVATQNGDPHKLDFSIRQTPAGGIDLDNLYTDGPDINSFISGEVAGGLRLASGGKRGFFYKAGATDTYASGKAITRNQSGTQNWKPFPYSTNVNGLLCYEFSFKPSQLGLEAMIGISTGGWAGPADDAIAQLRTRTDNTIEIWESLSGTLTQIAVAGQAFSLGETLRILVPVQHVANPPPQPEFIRYQKNFNGNWYDFNLNTATRYTFHLGELEVNPVLSIKTPRVLNIIPLTDAPNAVAGIITVANSTISTAGTNYLVGERCAATGGSGTEAEIVVNAIDGGGGITGYTMVNSGKNYQNGEILTLTGQAALANTARLTVTTAVNAVNVVSGGTNYVVGDVITDGATGVELRVLTVNGGVIQTFEIIDVGTGGVPDNTTLTYSNAHGGNTAQIDIRLRQSIVPAMHSVTSSLLQQNPTWAPLDATSYSDQEFHAVQVGFRELLNLNIAPYTNGTGINVDRMEFSSNDDVAKNIRTTNNMLIHLDNFPVKSKHKNGQGKAIASLPVGDNDNSHVGLFHTSVNWLLYHQLENRAPINANEMVIRITDNEGALLQGLEHPVVIDLDLRPRSR